MKRRLFLGGIALFSIALIASSLRVQPTLHSRLILQSGSVREIPSRVGWDLPWSSRGCVVPREGESLIFRDAIEGTRILGEPIAADVQFRYRSPARLPLGWQQGTWCESLRSRVRELTAAALERNGILDDPRAAGHRAGQRLAANLRGDGLDARLISVRLKVPEFLLNTRPVEAVRQHARKTAPVIFVGLDGADWDLLDDYVRSGAMPNLASLVAEGTHGVLTTEHPPLSPLLWTTMMTGVGPLAHGILDFTRFHPSTGIKEPITSDERRVPAIWNMATYGGKTAAVFGLWATYPAEPVNGLLVSDRFFTFLYSESGPPAGSVFPPSMQNRARDLLQRVENETDFDQVRRYLPWLTPPEYDQHRTNNDPYAHPISALRRILVETRVYDRLARETINHLRPDLTILYLQGTDSVGHVFAPYAPPRQPSISEEDFARYRAVPELYFREVDTILGRYKEIAMKLGAVLLLASDHGFLWKEGRPTQLSSFAAATAAKWHRKEGIYLLWGPGVPRSGRRGPERTIRQICPTLLALTGLPGDPRITSESLLPFSPTTAVDYAAYFTPPKTAVVAATGSDEEIAKLRALGYIGASEPTRAAPGSGTRTAGSYNNEGLILKAEGSVAAAIAAFEKAVSLDPNLASALWNLSDLLFAEDRDPDRSDELLVRAFANGLPEGMKFLIGRAIGYQRSARPEKSLALLQRAVEAKPDDPELRMFRGRYRVELKDCSGALDDFRVAQRLAPGNPVSYASAGLAALCVGDHAEAQRQFRRSLELNPNQPQLRRYVSPISARP